MTTTMKTTASTTTTVKLAAASACAGSGCDSRDSWPLYRVRYRGNFCLLCASCVLKYHAGSFCAVCFVLIDAGSAPAAVSCSKCPSVSHIACLPSPTAASEFVCPRCKGSNRVEYPQSKRDDPESVKVLLLASRIAANSMSRAAAVMRVEADQKVKEAAMARKRAREMLLTVIACWNSGENQTGSAVSNAAAAHSTTNSAQVLPPPVVEETKKKVIKVKGGSVDHKRVQSREIEKWMRFHEPIPIATAQGIGDSKKVKGGLHTKSRVGCVDQAEKDKKVSSLSTPSRREDEKCSVGDRGERGPRLSQPTQDALVSRTNPRPILTGSQRTTSPHS